MLREQSYCYNYCNDVITKTCTFVQYFSSNNGLEDKKMIDLKKMVDVSFYHLGRYLYSRLYSNKIDNAFTIMHKTHIFFRNTTWSEYRPRQIIVCKACFDHPCSVVNDDRTKQHVFLSWSSQTTFLLGQSDYVRSGGICLTLIAVLHYGGFIHAIISHESVS